MGYEMVIKNAVTNTAFFFVVLTCVFFLKYQV